ncbi:hypothetical protein D3C78_774850 [compost metagenome]
MFSITRAKCETAFSCWLPSSNAIAQMLVMSNINTKPRVAIRPLLRRIALLTSEPKRESVFISCLVYPMSVRSPACRTLVGQQVEETPRIHCLGE